MKEILFPARGKLREAGTVVPFRQKMRSFATQHWACSVPVPARMSDAALRLQEFVLQGDGRSYREDIERNDVAIIHPGSNREALGWSSSQNYGHFVRPVLKAFGVRAAADDSTTPFNWMLAHEVDFHVDEGMADEHAFLVWQVAGPAKAVVFAGLGAAVVMEPGDAILFDGMQPHGVRTPAKATEEMPTEAYRDPDVELEELTVYYTCSVPFTQQLRERMGIRLGPSQPEPYFGFRVDTASGEMNPD